MKPPPRPIAFPKNDPRNDMERMQASVLLSSTLMSEAHRAPISFLIRYSRRTYLILYRVMRPHRRTNPIKIDQLAPPQVCRPMIDSFFGEPLIKLTNIEKAVNSNVYSWINHCDQHDCSLF